MYSTEFDSGCLVCFIEIIHGRTPMRDTFVRMANNLGYQQELIVLSVLHTTSEAEICKFFTPINARRRVSRSFTWEFPPPSPSASPSVSPSSQTLSTSASQQVKCFSEEQELSELPTDGNRPMSLIRITGKGSLDSCF